MTASWINYHLQSSYNYFVENYDVFIGNVTDVSEENDADIFREFSTTPTNNAEKISNHTKIK